MRVRYPLGMQDLKLQLIREGTKLLPSCYNAIENYDLPEHHRDFLFSLTFDRYSRPLYKFDVAGIDGCYELKKEK